MVEEIDDFDEFKNLSETDKWKVIQTLRKMIVDLRVKADKNCEECEKNLLSVDDINIDMFFEDWRECTEHCNECGEEEKIYMCEVQFQLMSHIANSLLEIQRKQNLLTQIVLKRDETGSKLLKDFMKKKEELDKKDKDSSDIYR